MNKPKSELRIWLVTFGKRGCNVYFTEYHAEGFARALRLNGTECEVIPARMVRA